MNKIRLMNSSLALFLVAVVALTLTPLILMLHTSLKPLGTLTKEVHEVKFSLYKENTDTWRVRVRQDMRKFSTLSLSICGAENIGTLEVIMTDIQGRSCSRTITANLAKYLKPPPENSCRELAIPVSELKIDQLNLGLPEKLAESIIITAAGNRGPVSIDRLTLTAKHLTLANYIDVLTSGNFGRYFANSALIAIIITLGNLLFCPIVGYAFARKDFAFKNTLFFMILASLMIPPQVFIVPIFVLMKNIRWLNTYWALIVPSLVQPFGIFMMRQYISRLPVSLEDQARVDGATEWQILIKIIYPLSTPALAIVGINTFMGAWNTFLFPFVLTNTSHMRTLPVGLALYKNLQGADWVHLMAGSSITALPVIIVFLAFQKHIIAGLTTGLVKRLGKPMCLP